MLSNILVGQIETLNSWYLVLVIQILCFTLRSWVHEMFSHLKTVSPGLGDNYASKCSFDCFPHTKYTSPCVENSQNRTLMFSFSSILWRRFEKQGKLWENLSHGFPCFSNLLPEIGEKQNINVWFWEFSTHCDIYFVCGKLSELPFDA